MADISVLERAINTLIQASIPLLLTCDLLTTRQPPIAAEKAARNIITTIPAYNKALLSNKKKTVSEMSKADQTTICAIVTALKAFNGIINGL